MARRRIPLLRPPHVHWLRVLHRMNVPLSASERQSGRVLGCSPREKSGGQRTLGAQHHRAASGKRIRRQSRVCSTVTNLVRKLLLLNGSNRKQCGERGWADGSSPDAPNSSRAPGAATTGHQLDPAHPRTFAASASWNSFAGTPAAARSSQVSFGPRGP
jgi:hypothetical protein